MAKTDFMAVIETCEAIFPSAPGSMAMVFHQMAPSFIHTQCPGEGIVVSPTKEEDSSFLDVKVMSTVQGPIKTKHTFEFFYSSSQHESSNHKSKRRTEPRHQRNKLKLHQLLHPPPNPPPQPRPRQKDGNPKK